MGVRPLYPNVVWVYPLMNRMLSCQLQTAVIIVATFGLLLSSRHVLFMHSFVNCDTYRNKDLVLKNIPLNTHTQLIGHWEHD